MEYKDYYKILGVPRDADNATIRQAYRKMAKKYHPDVSKEANAESQFKAVGEAYEVLKDTQKRAAYDQLGSNWQQGQDFRPPPGWNAGFDFDPAASQRSTHTGGPDVSDFFSSLFGGGFGGQSRRQHSPHHASGHSTQNQQAKIRVDLEDALNGARRTISLRSASGERSLTVNIPKGVKAGQRIRLSGQGQAGPGGVGDLLLEIEFHPHPLYEIDGRDLTLDLPITPWEAALGATITVPVPGGGKADIKIPTDSRSGRKMRLKGKGIPGKDAGDLYIRLQIELPPSSNHTAKKLYEAMAAEVHFNPRAHLGV